MNKIALLIVLMGFAMSAISQDDFSTQKQTIQKNGLFFGINFLNHQTPSRDTWDKIGSYTNALEIGYKRYLHKNFRLLVPFQMGTADFPDSAPFATSSGSIIELDVLGQFLLWDRNHWVSPYLVGGAGLEYKLDWGDDNLAPYFPVGAGIDLNIDQNFAIGTRALYRGDFDENAFENWQINFGFNYHLGRDSRSNKNDRDMDGVTNLLDNCPDEAGLAELNGCPDNDLDGVANQDDACPDEPGPIENSGCPIADTDGDGISDAEDKCVELYGSPDMFGCPDTDGDGVADPEDFCPEEMGDISAQGCPDADGDGTPDAEDQCPNSAGGINGCPDTDGDGVPDSIDKCPNSTGTADGCPDADGDGIADNEDRCPNESGSIDNGGCPTATVDNSGSTSGTDGSTSGSSISSDDANVLALAAQSVQFETGSGRLKSTSRAILDQVAEIMKKYPSYSLSIDGHTDSIGDRKSNQRLSEKRAKACYDLLVKKGISGSRMKHQGFGESKPIATNKYKDGREKNRRVEFNLY